MDIRLEIVQHVCNMLVGKELTLDIVQDAITITLNKYELQERCTDIAIRDNSNENILKTFIATKRVEEIGRA